MLGLLTVCYFNAVVKEGINVNCSNSLEEEEEEKDEEEEEEKKKKKEEEEEEEEVLHRSIMGKKY